MQTSRPGGIKSVFVFGSFVAVIPLIFFPHSWGLNLSWNFWAVAGLELCLYFLIWQVIFSSGALRDSLVLVFSTALVRWGCGMLFGLLTFLLAGASFSGGIQNGLYKYFPAVLLQVVAAPLIIQAVWPERKGRFTRRPQPLASHVVSSDFSLTAKGGLTADSTGPLDEMLDYIKDYSGVEACLLVDQEGLILAQRGNPGLDLENLSPLAGLLESSCLKVLARMGEKQLEKVETCTPGLRLSVQKLLDFRLVVVSDRRTDDLLNIRIQRVVEQLTKKLSERYPQEVLMTREEEYVRNSGRT